MEWFWYAMRGFSADWWLDPRYRLLRWYYPPGTLVQAKGFGIEVVVGAGYAADDVFYVLSYEAGWMTDTNDFSVLEVAAYLDPNEGDGTLLRRCEVKLYRQPKI